MRPLLSGLVAGWRSLLRPASNVAQTLDLQLRAANLRLGDWLERGRRERCVYVDLPDDAVAFLRKRASRAVENTLVAADRILHHRFNLLGSGDYSPLDPARPAHNGYTPIDWYLDPVSGLRFPQGIPHTQWDLQTMRPGNADIKLPWELARCQHWASLGQAYRLSGDNRYAEEMAHQVNDFMEANPIGIGINWTCTMDVALRALNWALGLEMIKRCPALEDAFWATAFRHLYAHGVFIFDNLENKYEVTSNHFLSNVVGLYYLASIFRGLPEAETWNTFCRSALEQEIRVQILDDGADYESSVPYHRLVTELFLGAARLADFRDEPLSTDYREKLKKMVWFLANVLRPDGLMPQIGDADDGRLHILSDYGRWNPQDPRHLFAPAAHSLNNPAWLAHAGPSGSWEAAWWGFPPSLLPARDGPPADFTGLFPQAGLAVSRHGGNYLIVTNGAVGTKGFGNHKHNDQLGFELHFDSVPLIVDPGSYVYTSNPDARNMFRSTAYHNTLMIDGEEQNELHPEWLFRLFETAHAEHLDFSATEDTTKYHGKHIGYKRLTNGETAHERKLCFQHNARLLTIGDILSGEGKHLLRWRFHLAPGVTVVSRLEGVSCLEAMGKRYLLISLDKLAATLSNAWYSPCYGVRGPCAAIDFDTWITLNGSSCWGFAIAAEETFDMNLVQAIYADLTGSATP